MFKLLPLFVLVLLAAKVGNADSVTGVRWISTQAAHRNTVVAWEFRHNGGCINTIYVQGQPETKILGSWKRSGHTISFYCPARKTGKFLVKGKIIKAKTSSYNGTLRLEGNNLKVKKQYFLIHTENGLQYAPITDVCTIFRKAPMKGNINFGAILKARKSKRPL